MKTAEEKAMEFCAENGLDYYSLQFSLLRLIKEQDRDTRHACAEAVIRIQKHNFTHYSCDYIDVNEAHAACMNVKAC